MTLPSEKQHQPQTLLITGADGFVGQRAVRMALERGDRVIAVMGPRGDTKKFAAMVSPRLIIEKLDLTDATAVNELMARHTDIDAVLHAAALKHPPANMSIEEVKQINTGATQLLASACDALAAGGHKPLRFHFVSSISSLKYEIGEFDDNKTINAEAYGQTKCEASHWLVDHADLLKHLDIRISYPPAIVGPIPNGQFASKILAWGEAGDAQFEAASALHPELIYRMVHRDNYLGDVFSCFDDRFQPGVKEYAVQPDYQLRMGEYVRLAKQVVEEKKKNIPPEAHDVGEQVEMDLRLRQLPTVTEAIGAPKHTDYKLHDVLAAQYDVIAAERTRGK